MNITVCCPHCHHNYKKEMPPKFLITFRHDGNVCTAKANRYDDAFYEISVGKYKGNLVHVWDVDTFTTLN